MPVELYEFPGTCRCLYEFANTVLLKGPDSLHMLHHTGSTAEVGTGEGVSAGYNNTVPNVVWCLRVRGGA